MTNFLEILSYCQQLSHATFHIIKYKMGSDELFLMGEAFSYVPSLRHLAFEFLNCRIGDIEVMTFFLAISKLTQLESFTFSLIQNSNLSEEGMMQLCRAILRLQSSLKLKLYFRGLKMPIESIAGLAKLLNGGENNIKSTYTKQSLFISR